MRSHEGLRDWLESRRDELRNRVARIEKHVRHQDQRLDDDSAERAVEVQNDDVLANLDQAARDELIKIETALGRLDRGDYGQCVRCGNPISYRRLKSLPFAELCILCAEKAGAP